MTELQIQDDTLQSREMNRDPLTGTPGSHPVGTGLGAASGAAAGAAVGSMAGPLGTAVFGAVGALVGGFAGKGIGEAVNPTGEDVDDTRTLNELLGARLDPATEELYWQRAFITEPYYNSDLTYDDYGPAYRAGFMHRQHGSHRTWEEAEDFLKSMWARSHEESRLDWEEAKRPMQAAWYRADNELTEEADPYFGSDRISAPEAH